MSKDYGYLTFFDNTNISVLFSPTDIGFNNVNEKIELFNKY